MNNSNCDQESLIKMIHDRMHMLQRVIVFMGIFFGVFAVRIEDEFYES
jgi:hypothetical protein